VFRSHARVIQARRHRVGFLYLAVLVLQQHGIGSVQHARPAVRQRCGIRAKSRAAAGRLNTRDLDRRVRHEGMKEADGV
jgi:hypothetical protein